MPKHFQGLKNDQRNQKMLTKTIINHIIPEADARRFMRYVKKTPSCWNWVGHKNWYYMAAKEYGIFSLKGKRTLAHRASYVLFMEPISGDLVVHHRCENTICVRPSHLQAMTQSNHHHLHDSQRTHCGRGHKFTTKNTNLDKYGVRRCKECRNKAARNKYQRNKLNES